MPETVKHYKENFETDFGMGILWQYSVSETAPLHDHSFYEIFIVTKGKSTHLVNKSIQEIRAGDMVFIRPDDIHRYDSYRGSDFEFVNFSFSKEAFEKIRDMLPFDVLQEKLLAPEIPPRVLLDTKEIDSIIETLNSLTELRESYGLEYSADCYRSFIAYLICRYLLRPNKKKAIAPGWLISVTTQMRTIENFREGFPKMLELCNCSEEHLCREMKRYYGETPVSFINGLRLSYALSLLNSSDMEILEVSENCGFGNLSHFYHCFKKKYGMSPGEFRRQ